MGTDKHKKMMDSYKENEKYLKELKKDFKGPSIQFGTMSKDERIKLQSQLIKQLKAENAKLKEELDWWRSNVSIVKAGGFANKIETIYYYLIGWFSYWTMGAKIS